jgi:hypothetical protein
MSVPWGAENNNVWKFCSGTTRETHRNVFGNETKMFLHNHNFVNIIRKLEINKK